MVAAVDPYDVETHFERGGEQDVRPGAEHGLLEVDEAEGVVVDLVVADGQCEIRIAAGVRIDDGVRHAGGAVPQHLELITAEADARCGADDPLEHVIGQDRRIAVLAAPRLGQVAVQEHEMLLTPE